MERTFKVLVVLKDKTLSFPCSGHSPLTGAEALKIMESYKIRRPQLKVIALTENKFSATGYEIVSLEEMRTMYN